jgi:flagellar hook-associated protein 1 FlgK
MGSTFSGMNTALTSLYTQRKGLDVTGQNIANANTAGYTRQRVNLQSVGAGTVPALHSTYGGAGGGVTAVGIDRLRDAFLESRGQQEHGRSAQLSAQGDLYTRVEDMFGEPSDTGLQGQLSDLWSGFSDVANTPGDLAARSQLLQRAGTLTDSITSTYDALDRKWSATREELTAVAAEATTTAAAVAQLNEAIKRTSPSGGSPNELSDQRDLLVMKLAELVGATSRPGDDGTVDVFVGGTALVRGATSEALEVEGTTGMATATTDAVRLAWVGGGYAAAVTGGEAASHLDALGSVIPTYAGKLDAVAAKLAETVNKEHVGSFDLKGNPAGNFFNGTTASTIQVAFTDPASFAASAQPGGSLDGSVADRIAKLASSPTGADAMYHDVIVNLGVESQTATRRADIQANVTAQIDMARGSESSVDLDEEMVNLTQYQRAYEAAARMISAVDETLATLINMGR